MRGANARSDGMSRFPAVWTPQDVMSTKILRAT